jgi:hypothetical protein
MIREISATYNTMVLIYNVLQYKYSTLSITTLSITEFSISTDEMRNRA